MRELEEWTVWNRGRDVQVGHEADPVAPCVGRDLEARSLGQRRDLAHLAHTLGKQRIRLEDVVAPLVDQELELVEAVVVLAARDRKGVQLVAQASQPVVVVSRQRLFEPAHLHSFELSGHCQRRREAPCAVAAVAWLDAGLVGVDHDLDAVADRGPHGLHDLEVLAGIGQMKTKLHRLVSLRKHSLHVIDTLLWRSHLGGRAVGDDAVRETAPQPRDR